jgi:hypothetical protein
MRDEKKREEKIKARHPEKESKHEDKPKEEGEKNDGIKHSGSFEGKSNALGHGGRAKQLEAKGVPKGVIGELARKAHAAPGQANYHGK